MTAGSTQVRGTNTKMNNKGKRHCWRKLLFARKKTLFLAAVAFLCSLGIAYTVILRKIHAHDPMPTWEVAINVPLAKANAVLPIGMALEPGPEGAWDGSIREIGNIIFSPDREEWLFFYSGARRVSRSTGVFVGLAVSRDGRTFAKAGRVLNSPSEDPYVVLHGGRLYMFYEDKSEVPFRKVDLASSTDGRHWEVLKRGVIQPTGSGWQSQDVSSPVVIRAKDNWVMLYEGRGPGISGRLGFATSRDLAGPWRQEESFTMGGQGGWDHNVVPDDVMRDGQRYVLTYHGKPKRSSIADRLCQKGRIWQTGVAVSNDLRSWRRAGEFPLSSAATMMIMHHERHGVRLLGERESTAAVPSHEGVRIFQPATVIRKLTSVAGPD